MLLPRLVFADFSSHRIRFALTALAVALSVSLVVAVTTGYTSVEAAARKYLAQYMGTTDVTITPAVFHGSMDQSLVDVVRRQPGVLRAFGRYETQRILIDSAGRELHGRVADLIGVRRPGDDDVTNLQMEAGGWFNSSTGNDVVLDQIAAQLCHVGVGDWLTIADVSHPMKVRVVGIVHKPAILAQMRQTLYLPIDTLRQFDGGQGKISRILVDLKPDVDARDVGKQLAAVLDPLQPGVHIKTSREARQEMEKSLLPLHLLIYLGGATSMLAAAFIIFSALSMGVTERSRALAMMRAIGASKWQIASLVLIEGLCLSAAGVIIGIPAGLGWIKLLALWRPLFFAAGVVVSWGGVTLGSAGSLGSALLAAFLPAWSASHVSPLEALTPQSKTPSRSAPFWLAIAGLLLVAFDPLLVNTSIASPTWKYRVHLFVGLPLLMIGFFLIAPMLVRIVDWLGTWVIARLLFVQPTLLRQQLAGGLWRASGTAAALMVGLAVLVVMQVQGHSALASWRLPDKFPDIFIWAPGGLDPAQEKVVQHIPGIRSDQFMAIAYTSVRLELDESKVSKDLWPESTMFFGFDPDMAGKMFDMEFLDNDGHRPKTQPEEDRLGHEAYQMLTAGRAIIISDEFRQVYGLKIGQSVGVRTLRHGTVPYKIAGIVWPPGVDILATMFDMGQQFDERTSSSVFGTLKDLQRDFGMERVSVFAANLEPGVDRKQLVREINGHLKAQSEKAAAHGRRGRSAKAPPASAPAGASAESIPPADPFESIFSSSPSPAKTGESATAPAAGFSLPPGGLTGLAATALQHLAGQARDYIQEQINKLGLQAGDIRKIKADIIAGLERILMFLSTVALAALAVASLGVTNTVLASVRMRRWQFGILRSVGVTRGQLLRVILSEAVMLGIVASALGLGAGFMMSIDGNTLSKLLLGFAPSLQPPWGIIGIGVLIVMFVSLAASFLPAFTAARTAPLELLQSGRSAG